MSTLHWISTSLLYTATIYYTTTLVHLIRGKSKAEQTRPGIQSKHY